MEKFKFLTDDASKAVFTSAEVIMPFIDGEQYFEAVAVFGDIYEAPIVTDDQGTDVTKQFTVEQLVSIEAAMDQYLHDTRMEHPRY